jgi:cell division protein FtsN
MKALKMILPVTLLVTLAGCMSHHHHHSNVKIMTKSHHRTHTKATGPSHPQAKILKGKAKVWVK